MKKREVILVDTYQHDLFQNKICKFHKSSLEYACLEKNCYSKIKQICTKCVRKNHFNHQIADIPLLIQYVDQMKAMLIQSAAKFENKYLTIPLNQLKKEYLKIIQDNYFDYKQKIEGLLYRVIDLSINLQTIEEFNYSSTVLNKAISLVGKMELIKYYFEYIPNKWVKQVCLRLSAYSYEGIKESDIVVNIFDHYRFSQTTYKKIQLNLLSYRVNFIKFKNYKGEAIQIISIIFAFPGLYQFLNRILAGLSKNSKKPSFDYQNKTQFRGNQLVIIQQTKLYILELEDNKQRLLTHEVDSRINQVYQYKQQQNLLITCGATQPILVNNRIFNVASNYLLRVDFCKGEIKILKRLYLKNIQGIAQYSNKLIACQLNSNMIAMVDVFTMKMVAFYKIKFIIDDIMCFPQRDEILLFCNEKLICLNVLTKKQSCISGNYYHYKKKKIDQSHYALWNQNTVEIFDILKSHIKSVITLQMPIIDIEIILGKVYIIGKDRILHILN